MDEDDMTVPEWFCGCGNPNQAGRFLRDVLQNIESFHTSKSDFQVAYPPYEAKWKELFPTEGLRWFVFYVLDHFELTEHGGSVPGWLTEKGVAVLQRLKAIPDDEL